MDHAVSDPGQRVTGHLADRPAVDEASQHRVGLRQAEPIAGEGFAVCVRFGYVVFHQAQRLARRPGAQRGLGQATPPDFVLEAQRQGGLPQDQADQPVATVFFRP
jgi:hypothetical protein